MKQTLYRCKFKRGKLPKGWHDKEYNVIYDTPSEVRIGKTWIPKKEIEIIQTDFGQIPKFMRKITSLKPDEAIEINNEQEWEAIKELFIHQGIYRFGAIGKSLVNYVFTEKMYVALLSSGLLVKGPDFTKNKLSASDFAPITETQKADCIQAESKLQRLAKWVQDNHDTTSSDLFVYMVAEGLV